MIQYTQSRTCNKCGETKSISEYHKKLNDFARVCKSCRSIWEKENYKPPTQADRDYQAEYRKTAKNKEYMRQWRIKNRKEKKYHLTGDPEKRRLGKARYREKYREQLKERARKKMQYIKENEPGKYIVQRIRNSICRFSKGRKSISAMDLCGVTDQYHFFREMDSKTDNPNWHKENYAIDHIWQVHWFEDFSSNHHEDANFLDFLKLINHHENLRPLPFSVNGRRGFFDFTPLQQEDFEKYRPYLDGDIKRKIEWFFDHRDKFPDIQFNQGDEHDRFLRHLECN